MSQASRTRPSGSSTALNEAYDTALLDLDGVVYAGGHAIVHAVDSLGEARDGGMHLAYVTNNALRTPAAVAAHLTELGVPAEPADVITSAQAVARLMADQLPAGARVLVVGGEGLRVALRERGLVPVESADDEPVAVAQGYGGPDMAWGRFAEAAYAIARGVPWFASNTDLTIPSARGIAPGNGAAVEVVRIATGAEPQVAGKPLPPMHRETVLRTGAERPLVVGDRLDTDIEGAFNGGVDSLLVLTGVTDAAQLVAAPPEHRPTYVDADLRGLLTGQPEVAESGEGFRCGGWTASVRGDELVLAGDGDVLDGLRALCGAAWTYAGDGSCGLDAGKAVARLGL
ncbi:MULTISPECIES: HAD hydrolase-like protein [unclassified Streptomyces]|uniref:HAD hydrolase-like protein n=1 Tax=unclassified Streptomyces TaxID=2593676 RepID=UPI000F5BF2F5|nr:MULTISPECIES: HAD hydrolase-like protein [unclassified Streptomyces]WSX00661.1 HAD hydrolase-like protein [Streptomyces sp. NBC_00987]MCX5499636.1 HAD hydrolase-like protein [Streptomyces sp. NBC_00052]MCX5551828.1 HAD hydrolase-like protein [Streptomyces sp. NBC_00051]RPK71644.1 putative hydrolase YutF [Streptomyces sp. ADI95-17]WSC31038.1 HAD hydrolase-like protein [Streptomyces sp. NBC_01768]